MLHNLYLRSISDRIDDSNYNGISSEIFWIFSRSVFYRKSLLTDKFKKSHGDNKFIIYAAYIICTF